MSDDRVLKQAVLDEIQSGFPLEPHPYEVLAARLDADVGAVVAAVEALRAEGVIRRIGASFSSKRLGFTSVLCALAVLGSAATVDRVARLVNTHVEVTHNYLRDDRYNLWFTVIAADEAARVSVLDAIVMETGCYDLLVLPATALYKIRVDFSRRTSEAPASRGAGEGGPAEPAEPVARSLSAFDVALVRWAQADVADVEPFAAAAAALAARLGDSSIDEARVIERLRAWKDDGTMRRFGAMVKHRALGYRFNGMCVFDADPATIDQAGRKLAALPYVSHCYARPRSERWPYNLYAMAHAKTQEELDAHAAEMHALTGLAPRVLISTKEYKKTSPVYFSS